VEKALSHNVYSQLYIDLPMIQICDSPTHGSPMKHIVNILQYVKPKIGDWGQRDMDSIVGDEDFFLGVLWFLVQRKKPKLQDSY